MLMGAASTLQHHFHHEPRSDIILSLWCSAPSPKFTLHFYLLLQHPKLHLVFRNVSVTGFNNCYVRKHTKIYFSTTLGELIPIIYVEVLIRQCWNMTSKTRQSLGFSFLIVVYVNIFKPSWTHIWYNKIMCSFLIDNRSYGLKEMHFDN